MGRTGNAIVELQRDVDAVQGQISRLVKKNIACDIRIQKLELWVKAMSNPAPSAMKALVNYIIATIPPDELKKVLNPEKEVA